MMWHRSKCQNSGHPRSRECDCPALPQPEFHDGRIASWVSRRSQSGSFVAVVLKRLQILHEIGLVFTAQAEREMLIVVVHHVKECGEASIVEEATFLVGP